MRARGSFLRAVQRFVLAALLLLPAAAQAAMTSRDLNAAFDELDDLGAFFGAFAARETNALAQERWRRLSLGYPGTAEILRELLARERLILADLPPGRVSAVLDRNVIAIDRELDGLWSGGLLANGEGAGAARRRDLLLPALFEALGRRQPPQDWPWLADHLRAVGGFGALAQDPVARPLLARFFHAKDAYLRLALQRIVEGDPAVRRALATRQTATFNAVRRLATDLAATFGLAPADRLQRDWADYVAQVDGFAVTRGWLLLDPALRRTQLGEVVRNNADAVNRAAAEVVASAPRSAVAAARQEAAARRAPHETTPPGAPREAPAAVTLESIVGESVEAQAAPPDLEALAAALPLQALALEPAAAVGLDAATLRALAGSIEEAAAQLPDMQAAIAAREQQLGAARAEVASLESKVEALAAAAEDRAAEAERLEAALAAERARRADVEAQLAARQSAETARRPEASAEPKPLPQIAVLPPAAAEERPAASADIDQRVLYAVLAAAVLLLAALAWSSRRRRRAPGAPAPLLLTAPAADALTGGVLSEAPAPQPAAPRSAPVRVNGVVPPTAAARAAMKAGNARHAATSTASEPSGEADAAAHAIVQALRQGNLPLFELLFGELTDLRAPQLQRIVYGGLGEDLAIVCRAVGIDKLLFGSMYMLTDYLRGGDADEEAARTSEILRLYDRMPPTTARKVLAKWQRDWSDRPGEEPTADV